jgi:cytochrome c oxidase cbb3-type subunit 3
MKTASAVAGMLACAAIGAAVAGWIASHDDDGMHVAAGGHHGQEEGHHALTGAPVNDLAGVAQAGALLTQSNPLGDSEQVRMAGKRLYREMNCAGCHGYSGEGNMGPTLSDPYWIYGGTPVAIYHSLDEGRPKGMPAWGHALPPQSLWQLTAYVGSLGGGVPPDKLQMAMQGDYPGGRGALQDAGGEPVRDPRVGGPGQAQRSDEAQSSGQQ